MGNMTDQDIEEYVYRLRDYKPFDNSPFEHLYDWLQVANPEVFKQWEAVYDIEKEN